MADNSAKIIDVKFNKTKRRRGFKHYFRWTIFIIVLLAVLAVYLKYKFQEDFSNKQNVLPPLEVNVKPPQPVNSIQADEVMPNQIKPQIDESSEMKSSLKDIETRLEKLEERDDNLTIYLAVADLKRSLNNPDNFKSAVQTVDDAAGDIPEFTGEIDILKQASANGLVTDRKLFDDLEKLKADLRNSNNSFSNNIKNVFSDLVKVTKISGEVDKADYDSIIKRAELKLEKGNLSANELTAMITEIQNIGKPADNFVREANNLKRVLEIADALSLSANQRLAE